MITPLIGGLGTPELLIIFAAIILLFGAAKLPDLARSTGRSLRIFKAETKGLMDDDDEPKPAAETRPLPGGTTSAEQVDAPDAESARRSDPA